MREAIACDAAGALDVVLPLGHWYAEEDGIPSSAGNDAVSLPDHRIMHMLPGAPPGRPLGPQPGTGANGRSGAALIQ